MAVNLRQDNANSGLLAGFGGSSIFTALMVAFCAGTVLAQEEITEEIGDESSEAIEEIISYGIRRSVEQSIEAKRLNDNISDSIFAEEIGKSTDQSIAEALSRITGVTTQTEDGEGTQISIRGTNPQQNVIVLNGVQMSTTDFSQGIDLSAYSSDILQSIVVIKAPSADHYEGALGGIVYLDSAKPLELAENARVFTLQGRTSELAGDGDYKISGSISQKWADDTFGIIATAFEETYSVRRDQFRVSNYVARTSRIARDTSGNIVNDVTGLAAQFSHYELYRNERNRRGLDFASQWYVTEDTELSVNFSYSEQELRASLNGVRTRAPDHQNLIGGQPLASLGTGIPAPWTDPQEDWHTYDPSTRTFTKYLNRMALGDLSQSEDEFANEHTVGKLDFVHNFNDAFNVRAGISTTKSERIPNQSVYVNLQNYANINAWLLFWTDPAELEPVGYDCTGGPCRLVAGTGVVDYGPTTEPLPGNAHLWDNRSSTGFNPDDLAAQHLVYLQRNVVSVDDSQDSVYADFDWYVNFGGVRSIEFGARQHTVDKYVDNQAGIFRAVGEGVIVEHPETGEPIVIANGLTDITGDVLATGSDLGIGDFMSSLGYGRDNLTDGWTTFSAFTAFDVALGSPNVAFVPDNTQTRQAELDNTAFYLKANFGTQDNRLRGDIGVRYVETEVDTVGASGVNFASDPGNLGRLYDPFTIQTLGDSSLEPCPGIIWYPPFWNDSVRWPRVDGQGWNINGTPNDFTDDERLDNTFPCYDFRAEPSHPDFSEWWLWRHTDVSTEARYIYGDRPLDESGNPIVSDRSRRSFGVTGFHSYDALLPSLNLSYDLRDNMTLRFAASKTMSRPQIDSLRPGFFVTETQWGNDAVRAGNTITLFNTNLDPLESKNLDVSFEWYFDEGSLFSVGLFLKDMTNFEESEQIITYMDDLRGLGLDASESAYDATNLIRTADNLDGCMPRRAQTSIQMQQPWFTSGDPEQMCALFTTTRIRNGKGASIRGLEFQYAQQYRDLPGFWSGLGLQLNYTWQDSEFDQEVSSLDPDVALPALPVSFTPEHSYNVTVFWAMNRHQLRLAFQGASDVLVQRAWNNGTLWQEGRQTLDFSAIYAINDTMSISLDAVNLTDEGVRSYWTSRFLSLGEVDAMGNPILFDEGSPLDAGATKSRTIVDYRTGPIYRIGFRANF